MTQCPLPLYMVRTKHIVVFLLSLLCNMNRCAILFPRSLHPSSADENEMSCYLIVYRKRTTCRLALGPQHFGMFWQEQKVCCNIAVMFI